MIATHAKTRMAQVITQALFGFECLPHEGHAYVRMLTNRQSKETLERQHRIALQVLAGRETVGNLRRAFGDHEWENV